jgi:hypothetical protein
VEMVQVKTEGKTKVGLTFIFWNQHSVTPFFPHNLLYIKP